MAYLGERPSQTLASPTSQYFNGDGSTVAFTLNRAVNVAEDLEVFVNNIQQEPGVGKSYTATGTTLTFDAAPSSGTNNVYVVYRGLAEVTTRLEHDANAALAATTGTFSGDLTVDTNTLYVDSTNNRVGIGTSSPLAPLNASYIDASRNDLLLLTNRNTGGYGPWINFYGDYNGGYSFAKIGAENDSTGGSMRFHTANTSGTSTERMRIDASGRVTMPYQPVFASYGNGGNNGTSSAQNVTALVTKINVGLHFSSGVFTAPVAGVYEFHFSVLDQGNTGRARVRKNGADYWTGVGGAGELQLRSTGSLSNMWGIMHMEMSANDTAQLFIQNTPYSTESAYLYFAGKLLG